MDLPSKKLLSPDRRSHYTTIKKWNKRLEIYIIVNEGFQIDVFVITIKKWNNRFKKSIKRKRNLLDNGGH
jgi:hypothetical protein